LSVSAAMNMPKSAGESMSGLALRSASHAFITGLASAALISLLSWLMDHRGRILGRADGVSCGRLFQRRSGGEA
jgi:hypothetical protein